MKVALFYFYAYKIKIFQYELLHKFQKIYLIFRVNLTLVILLLTWGFKFCCLYSHLPSQTSF